MLTVLDPDKTKALIDQIELEIRKAELVKFNLEKALSESNKVRRFGRDY